MTDTNIQVREHYSAPGLTGVWLFWIAEFHRV